VPLLSRAPTRRQHLLKREPDLVLPERQQVGCAVREQPDIDVAFCEFDSYPSGGRAKSRARA
jgi:hypothetical protein